METKIFELRDHMTMIPIMAVRLQPSTEIDRALLARAGFGIHPAAQAEYVIVIHLGKMIAHHDPYMWPPVLGRTVKVAHLWIREQFEDLEPGQVIDVEYLLGESDAWKLPENGHAGGMKGRLPVEVVEVFGRKAP